jgi:putative phosphoribosyl transferase
VADLRAAVDEFVVLETSEEFFGIGQFYQDFTQVSDATVLRCLEDARTHLSGAKGAADVKPHVS